HGPILRELLLPIPPPRWLHNNSTASNSLDRRAGRGNLTHEVRVPCWPDSLAGSPAHTLAFPLSHFPARFSSLPFNPFNSFNSINSPLRRPVLPASQPPRGPFS